MGRIWAALARLLFEVRCHIPGTQTHRIHQAFRRSALYAVGGHVQICRITWQWEDEAEQRGNFFWYPAENADQLEQAARAYLASIDKSLADGDFIVCPKQLARLATWA